MSRTSMRVNNNNNINVTSTSLLDNPACNMMNYDIVHSSVARRQNVTQIDTTVNQHVKYGWSCACIKSWQIVQWVVQWCRQNDGKLWLINALRSSVCHYSRLNWSRLILTGTVFTGDYLLRSACGAVTAADCSDGYIRVQTKSASMRWSCCR